MDLHFQNSFNNHSQLNSTHKTGYTIDNWTFEEAKIYESAMVKFEDTSSMAFFEHVTGLMPWKTIESINNHGQILMKDMGLIKSSNGNFEDLVEEDSDMDMDIDTEDKETKKVTRRPKKKGISWTIEEHKLFLRGLEEEGKGEWKTISQKYLPNKTRAQIASHAQKYYRRMTKTPQEKRRTTINDIKLYPKSNFSLDFGNSQPSQLDFLLNSHNFQSNHATFSLNSNGFESNQVNFLSNSQIQSNQVTFPLNSQSFQPQNFQPNPFNFV